MGGMSRYSVVVKGIRHAFGRGPEVLRGVDLAVPRGGIYALLGLNGAGKTTLLRSLLGLVRPRQGYVEVLGQRLGAAPPAPELLARLGYVPERPFPDEQATAGDLLSLMRAVHPRWDEATAQRYLKIFHIPLTARCRHLSAGTKSQLALTLAMGGRPELLILDEPTLGLDPLHRHQYLQLLLAEATERDLTIILTSHDLYQIERMADTVAILHGGRILVEKPLDELKESVKRVRVGCAAPDQSLTAALGSLPGVAKVRPDPAGYLLSVLGYLPGLPDQVRSLPGVTGVQVIDLSLEEVFLEYCG